MHMECGKDEQVVSTQGIAVVDLRSAHAVRNFWAFVPLLVGTVCTFSYILLSGIQPLVPVAETPSSDTAHMVVETSSSTLSSGTGEYPESQYLFPDIQDRSLRNIDGLAIRDVVPTTGKMIVADLQNLEMSLYRDGSKEALYPIDTIGRAGTPWETPSGLYKIHTKEPVHFSSIAKVYMPYSMQFYGNYFIHGRTYYPDGTLTSTTFSGGCIKLATADAEKVFQFADIGTQVFVYDPKEPKNVPSLAFDLRVDPKISAQAYLVADLDTGDVYLEKNAQTAFSLSSITKLMTALVANETISFNRLVSVSDSVLTGSNEASIHKQFSVSELIYPLLFTPQSMVAETLESYIGKKHFVQWMNNAAKAYHMNSTLFVDASGKSVENVSTADDLFRLSAYITRKKSFVFDITREEVKTITASDGTTYTVQNINTPVTEEPFRGGKAGFASNSNSNDSMLSLLQLTSRNNAHTLVLVVLGSQDRVADTEGLATWVSKALRSEEQQTACVLCTKPQYRKIEL
jgi:serine-type D-Ala-D-Ala endopeptidase (penicillin-binding protein 7)